MIRRTWSALRRIKLGLKVGLSAVLLSVLFLVLPWHTVRDAFNRVQLSVWAGVLGGFLVGHSLGVLKWRRFVNAGRAGLRGLDATLCYSAGLFTNLCLPGIVGGDFVRFGLASRLTGRTEAALWGGVFDRVTDVLALSCFVIIGGLLSGRELSGWAPRVGLLLVLLALAGGVVALPFLLRRPLSRWPRRLRRPLGRSFVALRRVRRNPRVALQGIASSLVIQSVFVLLNAWLGRSVGIEVPLAAWFFAWPLAKLVAMLPISLGGLAVREASLAMLLLAFGVPPARSVVCSLLWQSVAIVGGLLGGALWLILSRVRHLPTSLGVPPTPAHSATAPR